MYGIPKWKLPNKESLSFLCIRKLKKTERKVSPKKYISKKEISKKDINKKVNPKIQCG